MNPRAFIVLLVEEPVTNAQEISGYTIGELIHAKFSAQLGMLEVVEADPSQFIALTEEQAEQIKGHLEMIKMKNGNADEEVTH